jgi:hypothetical protein
MTHAPKLCAKRALALTAAVAILIGFGGVAQAHDDEDHDEGYDQGYDQGYAPPVQYYHDWHAGPHVGPHGGCHWAPDYGYHCGPHVGLHSGEHHNWYAVPRYRYYQYGWPY